MFSIWPVSTAALDLGNTVPVHDVEGRSTVASETRYNPGQYIQQQDRDEALRSLGSQPQKPLKLLQI